MEMLPMERLPTMNRRTPVLAIAAIGFSFQIPIQAQMPKSAHMFEQHCIACHPNTGSPAQGAPDAPALRKKTPEAIVAPLANGPAHEPARRLSETDHRAIAAYLNGPNYMGDASNNPGDFRKMPNVCPNNA